MSGESLTVESPVAAWLFGKMPAHGDFISRGLDDEAVAAGDAVIAEALAMASHRWDAEWDEVYVETPVWRFMATPGVFGEAWSAGVFLASVDAVGRQYPLVAGFSSPTLALLAHGSATVAALDSAEALVRQVLLDALPVDTALDQLEGIAQGHFGEAAATLANPAAFAVRMLTRLESRPWMPESVWWVPGGGGELQLQFEGGLARENLAQLFRRPRQPEQPPSAQSMAAPTDAEPAAPAGSEPDAPAPMAVEVPGKGETSPETASSPVVSDQKPADPALVSGGHDETG